MATGNDIDFFNLSYEVGYDGGVIATWIDPFVDLADGISTLLGLLP